MGASVIIAKGMKRANQRWFVKKKKRPPTVPTQYTGSCLHCPTTLKQDPSCHFCGNWGDHQCYETECGAHACPSHFQICEACGGGYCDLHNNHAYCEGLFPEEGNGNTPVDARGN